LPDHFGLSRLKEGERVCGGRGQFGKQPLWEFNTISNLRISLGRCGMFDEANWKRLRKAEYPVLSNCNVR
jgi:hypothetical protein